MASSLALPNDILLLICEHLSLVHPPSLREFALVCRSWASIANTQLYRSISFNIITAQGLEQDIESFRTILQRSSSSKHLQRLGIEGQGPYRDPSITPQSQSGWRLAPQQDLGESCYATERSEIEYFPFAGKVWETCRDDAWQPLAALVSQLPALSDVLWNCPQSMPGRLLHVLHEHRPNCRLWVNTFHLRSLNRPALADEEWSLITSPCLHAIRAEYIVGGYDEASVARIIAGMAPNLKKVSLVPHYLPAEWSSPQKPPWQGFQTRKLLPPTRTGNLTSLLLYNMGHHLIQEPPENQINLNVLEHLTISMKSYQSYLSVLRQHTFENLKTLSLEIGGALNKDDPWLDSVRDFLLTIPSLSELKLRGTIHLLPLSSILDYHGHSLRRLWLLQRPGDRERPNTFVDRIFDTSVLIDKLPKLCPHLQELAIPIRRSRGDKTEVDAYKSLGLLPKLHTLDLTLDCSDYSVLWAYEDPNDDGDGDLPEPPTDPAFHDFEHSIFGETFINEGPAVRNGYVLHAMINAAVDEKLARSIFRCISSDSVENLSIKTRGGAVFSDSGHIPAPLRRVIDEISHDWVLERNVRDDKRDRLLVRDVPKEHLTIDEDPTTLAGPTQQVFRRLWPEDGRRRYWRLHWHSFPLEGALTD